MAGMTYSIKKNRLSKALVKGLTVVDNSLYFDKNEPHKYIVLGKLDSASEDFKWGRLKFNITSKEDVIYYVHAFAHNEAKFIHNEELLPIDKFLCDETVDFTSKKEFARRAEGKSFFGKNDLLLYGLSGRYLWIIIEIIGEVEGAISDIKVFAPGDNFMQTFPEVYRNYGDFFHRYISIYSTIYNDFQEKIDNMESLLDIEKAPKELLVEYADWLGIMVEGKFLSEETLRLLLSEAYVLNKYKGTRKSIERICEIILGEKPGIVESNTLRGYLKDDNKDVYGDLYGEGNFDVTIMISQYVDEKKRAQLLYLLRQYKPIRSKLRVVFLQSHGVLDSYSFMDMNSTTFEQMKGQSDLHQVLNGSIVLE